jgi:hypothetical protein
MLTYPANVDSSHGCYSILEIAEKAVQYNLG